MSLNSGADAVGMSVERLSRVEPVMRSYVERFGYAGISVLLARGGQVVFEGCYGSRDREAGLPMTADTIFRSTR